MMQKFLLLLALVAAAILSVEAHVKLHKPMSRIPYTAAEKSARYYDEAISFDTVTDTAGPVLPGELACGRGLEAVRGPINNKKVLTNDQAEFQSTIAVNHDTTVQYGIRKYADANDDTVVQDYDLWTSQSTAGLGILAWKDETNGLLLTDVFVIDPAYACSNCAIYARYYAGTRMWNSCSDVEIVLPTYGLRHDTNPDDTVPPKWTAGALSGKGYFKLATGTAQEAQPGLHISSVEYTIDGSVIGSSTAYPFALEFDSIKYTNGLHTIVATVNHVATTDIEGRPTKVTVEVKVMTENSCPTPSTKRCPDGTQVVRGIVPDCAYEACPMPTCLNGDSGNHISGIYPFICVSSGVQKQDFNTKRCGPLCDEETCCIAPKYSCGTHQCSDQSMYRKPTAFTIECNAPGGVPCTDVLCCAAPGVCADTVCQIAAKAMSEEAGEIVNQIVRNNAAERVCGSTLCVPSECCTTPAACGGYTCKGVPKSQIAGLYLACKGEACSEEECCDEQFQCRQTQCAASQHLILKNLDNMCSAVSCGRPGVCCEDNTTCSNFDCAVYNLPAPPDQASFQCDRQYGPTGIGTVICGVAECCVNTQAQNDEAGKSKGILGGGKTMVIAGVLLAVLVVVVGGFLVWKKQADASRGDHTRNMLDGAKVNAVQMRVPPANRQSVNAIYNTGGSGYV